METSKTLCTHKGPSACHMFRKIEACIFHGHSPAQKGYSVPTVDQSRRMTSRVNHPQEFLLLHIKFQLIVLWNIITSVNDQGIQQGDNTLAGKYSTFIFQGKNPLSKVNTITSVCKTKISID